jgi:two-component system response regulator PilR (NtrC family)
VQPKMLIVDDENAILFAVREYFMTRGWEVDCARGIEEAEALIETARYCAVITDLRLSGSCGTEGFEIVALIHQRYPLTAIIMMTAHGSRETEAEARRRGVDAFLHKPKPLSEVEQVVSELLRSSR